MTNIRGDASFLYLTAGIILVVLLGILFKTTILDRNENTNEWEIINDSEKGDQTQNSIETRDQTTKTDEPTKSPSQNILESLSSGGGGGTSSSTPSTTTTDPVIPETGCITRKLVYSIQNLGKNETCETYDGPTCIQRRVECSARIKNEDVIEANFDLQLTFVPDGGNKLTDAVSTSTESYTLSPNEQMIMTGTETVTSSGIDGIANNNVNCFFNTASNIEQEICS